jgi:hypothetical protein
VPRRDKRGVVTAEVRAARDGGERFSHRGRRDGCGNIGAGRRQVPRGAKGNEGIANNVGQTKGLIG